MKFEALEPAGADRRDIFRLDRRGFMNLVACASTLSLGAGCSTLDRVAPMPPAVADQVTVLGIQNARFWPDTHGDELVREGIEALDRERAAAGLTGSSNRGPNGNLPPANFLALSGGGDDGAFGAGLICGWSDSGKMPNFKLVTGVSTGSMIAPFAFLGGSYINRLRTLYTTIKPDDISEDRGLFGALFGEALADTKPLYQLISRYVDEQMLADIARGYGSGRLLLIGTTSLDEQRPVIWNMGAIAASGHPGALDLTRKVLLASASIPGAFPPVMIEVEAAGYGPAGRFAISRACKTAACVHYSQRQAGPGLGLCRPALSKDRRPRHFDNDSLQRLQRHLAHLCDHETRRGRLQPCLYRIRLSGYQARRV